MGSTISLDDDETYEFAQSLWLEVVGTTNKDEGLFSFIEYLNLIRSKAFQIRHVELGIWVSGQKMNYGRHQLLS